MESSGKGTSPAFEPRDGVVVEGFGEATIIKVRPFTKNGHLYDVRYIDGSTYTKIHESKLRRKWRADLTTEHGKKVNLIILFGSSYDLPHYRAVRQISCKPSDYLIDVMKRVYKIHIAIPHASIEDFYMMPADLTVERRKLNRLIFGKKMPLITIGEMGINDRDEMMLTYIGNQRLDWIPLPLTGGDVGRYCVNGRLENIRKKRFYRTVEKIGIHTPLEADKVWGLIRSHDTGVVCWEKFYQIFPEKGNFVDNFNQALQSLEIVLNDSYIQFYTEIERHVWWDLNICRSEKEKVIISKAYEAIKDAVLKNGYFNRRVVGLILSYYGGYVIPLPYNVNARERFFLRKEGIKKGQVHLEKLIKNEIVEKAKNEIYERLLNATSVECRSNLVHEKEVSIEWNIGPDIVRDAISKHSVNSNLRIPKIGDRQRSRTGRSLIGAEKVVKALMDHFKDGGLKVSEIWNLHYLHSRSVSYGERVSPKPNIRSQDSDESNKSLEGLRIYWRSKKHKFALV